MRSILRVLPIAFVVFLFSNAALAETCKLKTYAASWMDTGTPFSVECPSGNYSGHLVSTPARRFFRRGHLMLVFDEPVALIPRKEGDEGKIQPGRGRQISNMLIAGGVGIGAKDLADGISGAVFKAWYMIPITCVGMAFFSNGGDVILKPGFELQIASKGEGTPKETGSVAPEKGETATPDALAGLP